MPTGATKPGPRTSTSDEFGLDCISRCVIVDWLMNRTVRDVSGPTVGVAVPPGASASGTIRESAVPLAKNAAVRAFATAPSIAYTSVAISSSVSMIPLPLPTPPLAGTASMPISTSPSASVSLERTDCSTRTPKMFPPRSTTAMIASSVLVATAARFNSSSTSATPICVTRSCRGSNRSMLAARRRGRRDGREALRKNGNNMSENPFGPQNLRSHVASDTLFAPKPRSYPAFVRCTIRTPPGFSFIGRQNRWERHDLILSAQPI
jgi:hypothetical protein